MGNSNIMVVEDSGIVLLDIQKSLKLLGYSVVATASTKGEAIRKAKEARPDLVLMDIRLGEEMGGIEAADYIREHLDIPIVFLTGYADEDTFQRAKITGPFGYILKPFDPKGLQTTIEIALHNHNLKKELRESEKRYRTLVETMNDGVCLVDADGKITFVNDKLCQMIGLSREDLIGREHYSLFSDEFQQLQRKEFSKRKKGVSNSYETVLVLKDGASMPVILSGSPVQEHDGNFAGAIDVFTNVTPLKRAEAALVESETLYHDLVETAQDLIWQCDQEGRYTYLNPAWEEVFGYKIEEMLGKSFSAFQRPDDAARDMKEFSRLIQGESVKDYETLHIAKNGQELHLVFNAKSVYDQFGNVVGTRGTAYDITERKKSERALQEREAELQSIFRAAPVGIGMVIDRVIQEANRMLCQMTGYSRDELVGQNAQMLYPSVEDYEFVGTEKYRMIEEQGIGTVETHWKRKDGNVRDILLSSVPLDPDDLSRGVTFTALDITDRKQIEASLKESEENYRLVVESVDEGIISLDLGGNIIEVNPAFLRTMGFERDELLGKNLLELFPLIKVNKKKVLSTMKQIVKDRKAGEVELEVVNRRGEKIVIRARYSATMKDGSIQGISAVVEDITQRKRAEEYRASLARIFEDSLNEIYIFDAETLNFIVVNQAARSNLGYSMEELRKLTPLDLKPEFTQKNFLNMLKPLREGKQKKLLFGTVHLRKDRSLYDVEVHLQTTDFEGQSAFVAIILDVTERKKTEETIQESERRYRSIVESSPLGMHIYELQFPGKLVFVGANPAADKILGVDNSIFIGKTIEDAFPALVDTEVPLRYKEAAEKGNPWQTEQIDYDSEGIKGAFEVNAFQTSPNKMVAMFQDITSRRRAEELLRMRTRELETLFTLSSHLRAAQSADDMLPLVVRELRQVVELDGSAIILFDEEENQFVYALGDGLLAPSTGHRFPIENSISGMVMESRQPYVTDDLSTDPNKTSGLKGVDNLGPAIVVPLLSETDFLGAIVCGRVKREGAFRFSASDLQLLTAIGEMVGNALRRARLFDQALARLQNVQALHSIDMAISANMDLSVILEVLLTHGSAQLHADAASVLLLDPHTHILEYEAGYGFHTKAVESARLRLGEGLPGQVALKQESLYIPDISKDDRLLRTKLLDEGFVSYQAAPLVAKGQLQGVLEMFSRTPLTTNEEQANFFETLATQAAIAIDNSQLFTNLERSKFELEMAYEATIEGWSRALDLRDQETEGHTLRVADITVHLAQAMGLKGEKLVHIRRGALLHDIGKMGIPDSILLKPDKLSSEEWEIMKQHPVYAFKMLWQIEFLRPALDIPHCHHERWDGAGYPRGIKGRDIPLPARIFAVADVWDALISDRPYRQAWSEERAYRHILAQSGSHFDPEVVDAFMQFYSAGGIPTHGK